MKLKSKRAAMPVNAQSQIKSEAEPNFKTWRQTGLRLVAVFLIIVFLASECAALMPVQ
ncbi:MAG: hypothetical protein NTW32_01845 [Chloroflexi bacterium]|nr:hypothetical protein [Chloroflexota bacterium]